MTEFWGVVLAARSGLWSPGFTLGVLAQYAATYDQARQGRAWRNLADTTNQPIIAYSAAQSYPSWQRGKDYYTEGILLWLDVDTRIRELTRGRRSLDDFARRFFGVHDGELGPVTYTYEDVVRELNGVVASNWDAFLRERVGGHGPGAPLDGFARGGWQLTYGDAPTKPGSAVEQSGKQASFTFSLGLTVAASDGRITDVVWGSPAFKAGLAPGMTLLAVNGRAWSASVLKEAVSAAKAPSTATIDLLVRSFDTFQTARVDYHGGLRYPRLERIKGTEDRLSALLKPVTR
jgi:predicted metalloprotease with PDZ domain